MYYTPRIIKESHYGTTTYDIADEMLKNREITCTDVIDAESVNSLISQILYLEHSDPEAEITIYINTPGGEVNSGLALVDVIRSVSCPVRTICVGLAASMGALIFAVGDKRYVLPNSRIMIHDPSISNITDKNALQVQNISEDLMRVREITSKILAEHSGKSIEEIYEKTKTDTYFTAEEAIEFGLADCILENI